MEPGIRCSNLRKQRLGLGDVSIQILTKQSTAQVQVEPALRVLEHRDVFEPVQEIRVGDSGEGHDRRYKDVETGDELHEGVQVRAGLGCGIFDLSHMAGAPVRHPELVLVAPFINITGQIPIFDLDRHRADRRRYDDEIGLFFLDATYPLPVPGRKLQLAIDEILLRQVPEKGEHGPLATIAGSE